MYIYYYYGSRRNVWLENFSRPPRVRPPDPLPDPFFPGRVPRITRIAAGDLRAARLALDFPAASDAATACVPPAGRSQDSGHIPW